MTAFAVINVAVYKFRMNTLDQKLEHLPSNPGVYLFKDGKGAILYVGKAGNIKHRVNSYFQRPTEKDVKTLAMLEKISDIETIDRFQSGYLWYHLYADKDRSAGNCGKVNERWL